jgi:deoxyribonuclease-4
MKKTLLGAHVSITGGVTEAPERAALLLINTFQVFTKNSNRWVGKAIDEREAGIFRKKVGEGGFVRVIAHTDYLINPASANRETAERSLAALIEEIERCRTLGIDLLVMHPGSHGGTGIDEGIERLAAALNRVLSDTEDVTILLETTAGQGNGIGDTFEQIGRIIDRSDKDERLGVCYDTCHTFAAGYDIRTGETYERTMEQFDRSIGLDKLLAFHLNDSKKGLGSRVDRHQHIGWGILGTEPFGFIMNDERFINIPKIIETPKEGNPEFYDRINLDVLLGLVKI